MKWLRRPSRGGFFALLMLGAGLLALTPPGWTHWLRNILQPIAMLQRPVALGAQNVRDSIEARTHGALPADEADRLRDEADQLRRLALNQQLTIADLEERLAAVTLLREQVGGARVKLVIAEVVAYDTVPSRATIRISEGSRTITGLKPDLWVAAASTPPWLPPAARAREAAQRHWIIGRISDVQPFVSTVQLTTDPGFGPIEVQPASMADDGTWSSVNLRCALQGIGAGRMWMDRVPRELPADKTVIYVPTSELLPVPMVIGQVSSSRRLPEAPQHFNYEVRPWADLVHLRFVYIIVPAGS